MTIIALAGKKSAGKDSAGNVLVKKHGFTKIALADPLRELCSKTFSIPYNMFLDHDKKDKEMSRIMLDYHHIDMVRNVVESDWGFQISHDARENMEEYYGEEFKTPRDALRCVGNMLRYCVRDDIWIVLAMAKIKEIGAKIVITDCRFSNEREAFAKSGALICLIKRNDDGESKEHEFDLGDDKDYDVIFTNNGSLEAFTSSVEMWFTIRKTELQHYRVFKYE